MNKQNILILSAGRRVELVKAFKNASKKLGKGKIIAADATNTAPALYFADDFFVIKRVSDPDYIPSLVELIKAQDIGLVVPTIDTELITLSENRKAIENCGGKILISSVDCIAICRDKIQTARFLQENNFLTPKIYNHPSECKVFPLFIKPVSGSSSINAFKVHTKKELDFFFSYIENPLIQNYIEGKEYSVDVFCDFDAQPITIVPRERLATRSGEILKGKVVKDVQIIEETKKLVAVLKPVGQITVQLIRTAANEIVFLEINARFGGGSPMSILAGANSCENLFRLLDGENLVYNENYTDNLTIARFDDSVIIKK